MDATLRAVRNGAEQTFADAFAAAKPGLPGGGDIAAARDAAFARFARLGLPHRRVEEWKYTDLRSLLRDVRPLAAPADAALRRRAATAGKILDSVDCRRLVFADGSFAAEASDLVALEPGLTIRPMAQALAQGDPLVTRYLGKAVPVRDAIVEMNTAFMSDGVVIRVGAGATIARPLHLIFAAVGEKPAAVFTRSLVIVEPGARMVLVESHEGPGEDYQVNTALELAIGEAAEVEHVKITRPGARTLHLSSLTAALGARAKLTDLGFTSGGAVVRNQLFLRFDGEGASADLRGVTLATGRQHADTTLVADHAVGGCQSRELYKSVLDQEARGVFQGKIIVRPDAQQTDARMLSRALLLSDGAEADHKPELEIFADDVQCGHGATAGGLDAEARFYLMARGVPGKDADALLIEAFAAEALDALSHDGIRAALSEAAAAWLRARG